MTNASFLDQTLFAELAEKARLILAAPTSQFPPDGRGLSPHGGGFAAPTYIPPHRHLGKQG
jgi:hypothetical protein